MATFKVVVVNLGYETYQFERDILLTESDFITIHTPLTSQTRHLINAAALNKMKTTAILVNTPRGPVVDEAALIKALQEKRILAAGLDVFEKEPIGKEAE